MLWLEICNLMSINVHLHVHVVLDVCIHFIQSLTWISGGERVSFLYMLLCDFVDKEGVIFVRVLSAGMVFSKCFDYGSP